MSFFEAYFKQSFDKKETAVCCPFPHRTSNGIEYIETHPSAHINKDKGLFHCKVCGSGESEVGFIAKVLGTTYEDAVKLQKYYQNSEDVFDWDTSVELTDEIKEQIYALGIDDSTIGQLHLATEQGEEIAFPVFMYDRLLDVRSYRPHQQPKVKSRLGATTGLIIPFDEWVDTDRTKWTIICAGEKDMAVARSNGFNAITITGGEMALPKMLEAFRDRRIAITYDNDDAGRAGAKNLAWHLRNHASEIRIVTGFHEICTERGEDITDFFVKYKRSDKELKKYILNTPPFTKEDADEVLQAKYPQVSLLEASSPKFVNKVVQSNIQVVATYDKALTIPTTISAKKLNNSGDDKNNKMLVGDERTWILTESNAQDVLKLMDNNFTENQVRDNIREILNIPKSEHNISVHKPTKETIYKCNVVDLFESTTEQTASIEFEAYVLRKKMEAGKKYRITYKLVPHPYKGQQLTMIIVDVEDSGDNISSFKINEETKQQLALIGSMPGSVKERIEDLTERVKAFIKYDGFNQLIQAFEFSFHTVLEFNFGSQTNIRGYLDTIIVAESRIGKSTTAEALRNLYGVGIFTSLAGNSATIPGLIGGSNKVNNTFQTRAGVIPQNHRGLIIFEELAKCNANIIKELTDIKSSNRVRIARVSGTLELPALVRMITLTNAKANGGHIRSISSYPNGIEVLVDLIGTAEDIARFDLMLVLGETGNRDIDPYWVPNTPFTEDVYRTRIRWIWSRTPEQIIINNEVGRYILLECNKLNKIYDSYIKIFGTEAWKKVARLAVAVAGYLVSTDETFENIVVTKEHVDYAIQYLVGLYDNPVFKFKQFVDSERRYTEIDDAAVDILQAVYIQSPALLLHLEQASRTSKTNLVMSTGLDTEEFANLMAKLVRNSFIKLEGFDILPTERFRKGMGLIERGAVIMKEGEHPA